MCACIINVASFVCLSVSLELCTIVLLMKQLFSAGNGGGRGDPHFITLDGVQYTFNGLGEYTLLDAHNGDFVINILTKQAEETGGSLIPATSISVIAMKMRNRPVIQAQLDEIFGIKLLVESNMTETGYRELEFEFVPVRNFDGGHVEVEEEFSRNFMLENGVVIVIKASNDILSFQLSIPHSFRDNTKGLLGVWNGNQSDDFLRPDGTTFSIDSSEEEIFDNFGEKCVLIYSCLHCILTILLHFQKVFPELVLIFPHILIIQLT